MTKYEVLLERVQEEIPGFSVVKRSDSLVGKFVDFFVGKILRQDASGFRQLIGKTMYVPDYWDGEDDFSKYRTLRHELIHARQWKSWFISWLDKPYIRVINYIAFAFCYLFVLPVLWTFRAKFEREAYEQSLLTSYELGWLDPLNTEHQRLWLLGTFTGPSYLFMSTKGRTQKWFDETIERIFSGDLINDKDRVDLPR